MEAINGRFNWIISSFLNRFLIMKISFLEVATFIFGILGKFYTTYIPAIFYLRGCPDPYRRSTFWK